MTDLRFSDYEKATVEIAFAVIDRVGGEFGASNQSCSTYVSLGWRKVRFSNHADRHGSDRTWRVENLLTPQFGYYDDDGNQSYHFGEEAEAMRLGKDDYSHVTMKRADFDEIVNEAAAFLLDQDDEEE